MVPPRGKKKSCLDPNHHLFLFSSYVVMKQLELFAHVLEALINLDLVSFTLLAHSNMKTVGWLVGLE